MTKTEPVVSAAFAYCKEVNTEVAGNKTKYITVTLKKYLITVTC